MSTHTPLHQLTPLTRFADRANDYANYRPSYPAAAIDALFDGLAAPDSLAVADMGAGTGISARLLAERGARVMALEPNAKMREAAEPHSRVTFVEATAEKTGFPDQSVDLVTAFQSFHWFEPQATLTEFHRILRASGRVALVWNERDWSDAFTAGYGELIREAVGDHPSLKRGTVTKSIPLYRGSPLFRDVRELVFPNSKRMTCDGLLGASLSGSYVPKSGPAHDQLMDSLRRLHAKFAGPDGYAEMVYRTEVMLAERT